MLAFFPVATDKEPEEPFASLGPGIMGGCLLSSSVSRKRASFFVKIPT